MQGLGAVEEASKALKPRAFMIVQDGKAVARWGDVSAKTDVASVRKSLLRALYGIAVSEGRIELRVSGIQAGTLQKMAPGGIRPHTPLPS